MANWFYLINGQEAGPIDSATLKNLAASGQLKPTDKLRREEMQQWVQAKQVTGLFSPHARTSTSITSRPAEVTTSHAAQKTECVKTVHSTAELFTRPWRRFQSRWARAAVFLACCAIVIPISKWAGRLLGTQMAEVTVARQAVLAPSANTTSLNRPDEMQPTSKPSTPGVPADGMPFANSEKLIFDTSGHKNAKGVQMKISYPSTWKAEEGDQSATVQRFISDAGRGNQSVLVQTFAIPELYDRVLLETEKEAFLSRESMQDSLGGDYKILSHRVTKLDGETCAFLEWEQLYDLGNAKMGVKTLVVVLLRGGVQVMISCNVRGDASVGFEIIRAEYDAVKPVFSDIVGSCDFHR